jgi:predicted DCC family thiol-disulfide oxidoreductase YuxK
MSHASTSNLHSPPRRPSAAREAIFYDGHCGLCHGLVLFVLARDRGGAAFRFAPLGGESFRRALPAAARAALPDSIVLLTATGEALTRSAAVLHILDRLGGAWRLLSRLARLCPRPLRDFVYDRVAGVRHKLFARPADVCPVIPAHLRDRFDA